MDISNAAHTDIYTAPGGKVSMFADSAGTVRIFSELDATQADIDEIKPVIDALMDGKAYTTREELIDGVDQFVLTPA